MRMRILVLALVTMVAAGAAFGAWPKDSKVLLVFNGASLTLQQVQKNMDKALGILDKKIKKQEDIIAKHQDNEPYSVVVSKTARKVLKQAKADCWECQQEKLALQDLRGWMDGYAGGMEYEWLKSNLNWELTWLENTYGKFFIAKLSWWKWWKIIDWPGDKAWVSRTNFIIQ